MFLAFSISMTGPGMLSFSRTAKYCTKLADEVMNRRGEKALMDFKILVKDGEFPCAKFIMAAHSPMLRAMLSSNMAEVAKQEIRLNHIRKDIIQIILDYMYCEDMSFHKDDLVELIAAADYLQMTDLKEMCLGEVPCILESGNVISWWKEAAKMNYVTIKNQSEEMIAANFKQISQQIDFLNLDLKEMDYCMSDICSDTVNSDDILDAVMRWTSHEDERLENLEDLLQKVKLDSCSAEGIKNAMETYESLLDKKPVVCKLLLKTSVDIAVEISKKMTDTVIIVGGQEGVTVNDVCWKVDQSDAIVQFCDVPIDELKHKCSVCKVPHGFVITGGADSCLCIMFIASAKSWVRLQDILQERQCHGSVCVNEVLYVLGGYLGQYSEGSKASGSVNSMILKNGNWEYGPNLPRGIKFPKVSNCDESVYLLDAEKSKLLFRLDVAAGTWHDLAPLPVEQKCHGVSMTSANRRLLVAGGRNMICAWFNIDTNTWSTGKQPLRKHYYGSLAHFNGKFLLLGGSFEGGTDEIEVYDIEENKWTLCTYKMPQKLCGHYALLLKV